MLSLVDKEMMNKYRYRIKYQDGTIIAHYFTLEDIENHKGLNKKALEEAGIEILSRDRYTEQKDKNGVEIYEGDTLKYPKGIFSIYADTIGTVCYCDGCFICSCSKYSDKIEYLYEAEVIGNIYENPELIEVDQ